MNNKLQQRNPAIPVTTETHGHAHTRVLRLHQLMERLGYRSRGSIYRLMAKEGFPRPIQFSSKSVGWIEASVEKWLQNRIANSEQDNG